MWATAKGTCYFLVHRRPIQILNVRRFTKLLERHFESQTNAADNVHGLLQRAAFTFRVGELTYSVKLREFVLPLLLQLADIHAFEHSVDSAFLTLLRPRHER